MGFQSAPVNKVLFAAGAADGGTQQPTELTGFTNVNVTVKLSISVALTGSNTITLSGTNVRALGDVLEPTAPLTNAVNLGALPTGVTLTNGVLAFGATVATGTTVINLSLPAFPQFLACAWDYSGGGGTVALSVTLAGW